MEAQDKSARFYSVSVLAVCVLFLGLCAVFLMTMAQRAQEESLRFLQESVDRNQATIQKQIQSDFETLSGIAAFIGNSELSQSSAELRQVLRVINDGNAFVRMGYAPAGQSAELLEMGTGAVDIVDLSNQPFFRSALAGTPAISMTQKDDLSGTADSYVNYYGVPVTDLEGRVKGVLCAANNAQTLCDVVDTPLLSGEGWSSIVGAGGNFVIRGSTVPQPNGQVLNVRELGQFSDADAERLSLALEWGDSADFQYQAAGRAWLAVVRPLGINEWMIISSVPEKTLRGQYTEIVTGLAIIIALSGLIFFLLLRQQRKLMLRNQEKLMDLAYRDGLTGCRNFEKFELDARPFMEARPGTNFAVWYCDLKKFKYFNDMFGYHVGDQVLRRLATLLEASLGDRGLMCRVSADNFCGLLSYEDQDRLERWYDWVQSDFAREESHHSNRLSVDLTMGFYCVREEDGQTDINDMVNWANMAQKSVKHLAGGRSAVFTGGLRARAREEAELEAGGKLAIASGEIELWFQPKVNIQRGNLLVGAEVLARWNHPIRGLVSPGVFIPLFEESDLIIALDRYMFEQTCIWLRDYLSRGGQRISLAVNVSRLGLIQEDFVPYYAQVKERYGIPDGILELEFTESVLLNNTEVFLHTVLQLQSHGFICSMDDFGSGYSSLNILKNLPMNVVKLDILFFHKSIDLARERTIITSIVDMARKLGMKTIAEGVEAQETVDFLRQIGCDVIQGYVFAKPMPMAKFEALTASGLNEPIPYSQ